MPFDKGEDEEKEHKEVDDRKRSSSTDVATTKKRTRTTQVSTVRTITKQHNNTANLTRTNTTSHNINNNTVIPDPPIALIELLQKDTAVLQYFQLIQQQWNDDIQKWKCRYQQLKSDTTIKKQLQSTNMSSSKKVITRKKTDGNGTRAEKTYNRKKATETESQTKVSLLNDNSDVNDSSKNCSNKDTPNNTANTTITKNVVEPTIGIPIDDTIFDDYVTTTTDDDDDDDDDDDNVENYDHGVVENHNKANINNGSKETVQQGYSDTNNNNSNIVLDSLIEVYTLFQQHFHIAFVVVAIDNNVTTNSDINSTKATSASPMITARTNEQICIDIIQYISTMTENCYVEYNDDDDDDNNEIQFRQPLCCNPIDSSNGQNIDVTQITTDKTITVTTESKTNNETVHKEHPLLIGKRLLLRALYLIDTFCCPYISQKEWDNLFTATSSTTNAIDPFWYDSIRIGLRSRKLLIEILLYKYLIHNITTPTKNIKWTHDKYVTNRDTHNNGNDSDNANGEVDGTISKIDNDKDGSMPTDKITTNPRRSINCVGYLVKRSIICQITTGLFLFAHNNVQNAVNNICQYIMNMTTTLYKFTDSTNGSIQIHEMEQQILSFNVIESLLLLSDPVISQQYHVTTQAVHTPVIDIVDDNNNNLEMNLPMSWFHQYVSQIFTDNQSNINNFYDSLCLVLFDTFKKWEHQRIHSSKNIPYYYIAEFEISCYQRLLQHLPWLRNRQFNQLDCNTVADQIVQHGLNISREDVKHLISPSASLESMAIKIALLASPNNVSKVDQYIHHTLLKEVLSDRDILVLCELLRASNQVKRQIEIHQQLLSDNEYSLLTSFDEFAKIRELVLRKLSEMDTAHQLLLLCAAMESSVIVADGMSTLLILHRLLKIMTTNRSNCIKSTFQCLRDYSKYPVVRVINLERRKDRMRDFMIQALRERLVILKAVACFHDVNATSINNYNNYEYGGYAIDGKGRLVEATEHLVNYVGSIDVIDKNYVQPFWRPNDLKPFDVDAPSSDALVRISPSERACALSHILSWRGVRRSLQSATIRGVSSFDSSILRLYKISGFAQGKPLLPQNAHMPPTPVCVILEDDAILVNNFTERLNDIFQDLPRDFHYCSLGYSRPKSAPIVPCTTNIGIPSMLWYLTGYCISEAGAQHLLDSLPVVGPVDSWIGLKMTSNWDNIYGIKLGVGIHSKPNSVLPSNKHLCRILKFRAYCAMQPLCSQKVRTITPASTSGTIVAPTQNGRQWRQRDTDIEYSGSNVTENENRNNGRARRR